jgi:hypothetical protein
MSIGMDFQVNQEVLLMRYDGDGCGSNLNEIVGCLESILVNESFSTIQNDFCTKHAS